MTVIDVDPPSRVTAGSAKSADTDLPGDDATSDPWAFDEQLSALLRADLEDEARPPSSTTNGQATRCRHLGRHAEPGVAAPGTEWDRVLTWAEELPLVPDRMYDHELLDATQERVLAKRVQRGIVAAQAAEVAAASANGEHHLSRIARREIREGRRAVDTLVRANLRLARVMATRIPGALSEEDRISFGILGLMRATQTFDPDRGRFSTYATWWIRQTVSRGVDDTGRLIRIPVHAVDRLRTIRRTEREMTGALGRTPTREELAVECDISPSTLAWLQVVSLPPLSLDDWIGQDDPESRTSDWWTILTPEDSDGSDPFAAADQRACDRGVIAALDRFESDVQRGHAICTAPGPISRSVEMLRLRTGLVDDEEWTLERIGQRFGITRERVRQIVSRLVADPELRRRVAAAADLPLTGGMRGHTDEGGAGARAHGTGLKHMRAETESNAQVRRHSREGDRERGEERATTPDESVLTAVDLKVLFG